MLDLTLIEKKGWSFSLEKSVAVDHNGRMWTAMVSEQHRDYRGVSQVFRCTRETAERATSDVIEALQEHLRNKQKHDQETA